MSDQDFDTKIGQAWKAHYDGQDESAVDQFEQLAAEAPDNVDVLWGLGLAYRRTGDYKRALEVFEKVQQQVSEMLDQGEGDHERNFMLKRMSRQQIEQVSQHLT